MHGHCYVVNRQVFEVGEDQLITVLVLVLAHYSEGSEVQLQIEGHFLAHVAEYFSSEYGVVPEILAEFNVEQPYIFQICIETFYYRLRLPSRQL